MSAWTCDLHGTVNFGDCPMCDDDMDATHEDVVDMTGLAKWLKDHPAREKPYDAVLEERMAHVANGGTVRNLPTDPAVRGGRRPDRRDGDYRCTDGETWHYEPYSGDVA